MTTTLVKPCLQSLAQPQLVFVLTKSVMTIGRAADCDIQIPETLPGAATVSRYHARLEKHQERWRVIDGVTNQPSTNGVFVQGQRTRDNYLKDGDCIAFGLVSFRLLS